jgi:hypothetical protein
VDEGPSQGMKIPWMTLTAQPISNESLNECVIDDNRNYMAHLEIRKNYNQSIPHEYLNLARGIIVNRSDITKSRLQLHFTLKIAC